MFNSKLYVTFAKGSSQCLVDSIVGERAPSHRRAGYSVETGGLLSATIGVCECVCVFFTLTDRAQLFNFITVLVYITNYYFHQKLHCIDNITSLP